MVLGEDLSILLAEAGKTIIFVTHSLAEAGFLSDRIALMTARPGRIKAIIDVNEAHRGCPRSCCNLASASCAINAMQGCTTRFERPLAKAERGGEAER